MYDKELKTLMKEIPKDINLKNTIQKEFNKMAKEIKKIKDRAKKIEETKKAKLLKKKFTAKKIEIDRKKSERISAKQNIEEVKWLKNI